MAAIWKDVEETRAAADACAATVERIISSPAADEVEGLEAAFAALEALRLEIRAASQTVSHALTVLGDDLHKHQPC